MRGGGGVLRRSRFLIVGDVSSEAETVGARKYLRQELAKVVDANVELSGKGLHLRI